MGTPYNNAHARAKNKFGPAAYNACAFCGLTAEQYALDWTAPVIQRDEKGRAYSADPDWYLPTCRRCHSAYDKARHGLTSMGLIRLRERLWGRVPEEAREAQRKSRESAQDAFLRYTLRVSDVVRRRVRVME